METVLLHKSAFLYVTSIFRLSSFVFANALLTGITKTFVPFYSSFPEILYKVAGKGTFISNIDGSSPIRIANLNAPVWLGNEWIIGMNDKDNGERILSSSIEAVSIDGQKHQTLSDPSTIAMFPAVSTDNSSIAFNSDNGDIYLMKINIKQKAK